MTALEARLRGTHHALTPVVDVAREPRWGRVEETYGEDPFLVSRLGIAAVRGSQGDATFRDFEFGSGESLPELRIHWLTLGTLAFTDFYVMAISAGWFSDLRFVG